MKQYNPDHYLEPEVFIFPIGLFALAGIWSNGLKLFGSYEGPCFLYDINERLINVAKCLICVYNILSMTKICFIQIDYWEI